jgi:hypothetical protein
MKVNFAPDLQPFRDLNEREQELLAERIRTEPTARHVTVWANAPKPNTILDGHNTLKECERQGMKPVFVKLRFDSRQEARAYAIRAQLGRRNLDPEQFAYWLAELTKETRSHGGRPDNSANFAELSELAEEAGVSRRTMGSAARVADKASAAVKQMVANGEVAVSDAAAIAGLPKAEQTKIATKAKRKGLTLRKASTAFNPKELGSKPKRGKEILPARTRKEALDTFGKLLRILDKLRISADVESELNTILKAIKAA